MDIKDASGYVAFDTDVPEVKRYDAERAVIRNIDLLVDKLHRENIYVIARIVIFVDPRLALTRPDLAVHQASKLPEPHVAALAEAPERSRVAPTAAA